MSFQAYRFDRAFLLIIVVQKENSINQIVRGKFWVCQYFNQ